jgi:hypothetical protein
MSRRKINPIPILIEPVDTSFPTNLRNEHVTRFGNPATPLGARYVVSDRDGLRQVAIDLEHLRLITNGVPITDTMFHLIEDRVKVEQVLLDHRLTSEGIPKNLSLLLDIGRVADARKYTNQLQISEYELFLLIHNCEQLGWGHRSKFPQYVPDHLQISDKDRQESHLGRLEPLARKLASTMEERRCIHVHLFERGLAWHCFYFSNDDLREGKESHWKHGPHLHYVSHQWPKYSKEEIWSLFDTRQTKISGAIHVRFRQFEYSSSDADHENPPFSPYFGYQPMLIALDARSYSIPNRNPIPIAQVVTRGIWCFDISLLPD